MASTRPRSRCPTQSATGRPSAVGYLATESAQRDDLESLVADLAGVAGGRLDVEHRGRVVGPGGVRPRPEDERATADLDVAGQVRGVDGVAEQRDGVVGGGSRERVLAGVQPRPGGSHPLLRRRGMDRHRLGTHGEQVRRNPVVGHPGRLRRRRVEHVADQVVRELVVAAGDDEQPCGQRVRAGADHRRQRLRQQARDGARLEGHAEDRAGSQQCFDVGSGPAYPGQHCGFQRLRDAGGSLVEGAQRLDDVQRVASGARHDVVGLVGETGCGRETSNRVGRQRAEADGVCNAGEGVEDVGSLFLANRCSHEDARVQGVAREVVQQLQARPAGVLDVIEAEEHRRPLREAA